MKKSIQKTSNKNNHDDLITVDSSTIKNVDISNILIVLSIVLFVVAIKLIF